MRSKVVNNTTQQIVTAILMSLITVTAKKTTAKANSKFYIATDLMYEY